MSFKSLTIITIVVCLVLFVCLAGGLFETNSFGNYQIKQAAVTGHVTDATFSPLL